MDSVNVSVGEDVMSTHVASRKGLRRAAALFPVLVLGALSGPLAAAGVAEDGDRTIDKAGCTVCHKMTPKLTAHSPREMHVFHKSKTPRSEAECFQCHIDAGAAQTKSNVFANPQRNASGGCHPAVLKPGMPGASTETLAFDHQTLPTDDGCASCHSPADLRAVHLKAVEAAENK